MKELILATLTGVCAYALILLASIGLDALGTWLYGWETSGGIFAVVAGYGIIPATLIGWCVYEEIW